MKKKLFLAAAILASFSLAFVSCGDKNDSGGQNPDDDESEEVAGNQGGNLTIKNRDDGFYEVYLDQELMASAKNSQAVWVYFELVQDASVITDNGALAYISPAWSRNANDVWVDSIEKYVKPDNLASLTTGAEVIYKDLTAGYLKTNKAVVQKVQDTSEPNVMVIAPRKESSGVVCKVTKVVLQAVQ